MSLRRRLALALVLAAALPVVVLGVTSYVMTSRALHREVDASLQSYAERLADHDGRSIDALCKTDKHSDDDHDDDDDDDADEILAGMPGASIECISSSGDVIRWVAPSGLRAPPVPDGFVARTPSGVGPTETVSLGTERYHFITYKTADDEVVRLGRSLAEMDHSLGVIRAWALGTGIVVILAATTAGVLLARRITRPIEALTTTAELVARTGELDRPVPVGRSDEIGRLASALATMLGSLHESRSQQQQLVQDAGHELRTPLTSARANIDTVRRHPTLPGPQRDEMLAAASTELTELSTLMDELVTLAIEERDREPNSELQLDELAQRAAARTRARWHREVSVTVQPVTVDAPPRLLARAVGNLLENAVKFSPDGSVIEVAVTAVPPVLSVRDHGHGIGEADLPRVFDRFHRAVEARSMPGSGLGLSIVRRAAEESNAVATAANHPDGGALFTIRWAADDTAH